MEHTKSYVKTNFLMSTMPLLGSLFFQYEVLVQQLSVVRWNKKVPLKSLGKDLSAYPLGSLAADLLLAAIRAQLHALTIAVSPLLAPATSYPDGPP